MGGSRPRCAPLLHTREDPAWVGRLSSTRPLPQPPLAAAAALGWTSILAHGENWIATPVSSPSWGWGAGETPTGSQGLLGAGSIRTPGVTHLPLPGPLLQGPQCLRLPAPPCASPALPKLLHPCLARGIIGLRTQAPQLQALESSLSFGRWATGPWVELSPSNLGLLVRGLGRSGACLTCPSPLLPQCWPCNATPVLSPPACPAESPPRPAMPTEPCAGPRSAPWRWGSGAG